MSEYAIRVKDISKMYKLYENNNDRLKEALGFSKQKRYKEHYALHHVSFDVNRGETVGIIGTNGAGKSTILKIITGVLNPTEGDLQIAGRISALLELGAGFNQEYSGMENVYLNGTMMGYSREEIEKRVPTILEFADIGDFIHQPVKTYSSGMFVRLAFALAINIDPEILVVDEALSVGDVFFQAKCYKKFEEFKKAGKTILFVSHDLGSIAKYCDRVVLLNKGEKLSEGKPKEMIDMYKKILTGSEEDKDEVEKEASGNVKQEEKKVGGDTTDKLSVFYKADDPGMWKSHYEINKNVDQYGNKKAVIRDFAILDENGNYTNTLIKGSHFTMKTKVEFMEDVEEPIFTYTFKTVRGVDVTGTNTMYEKKEIKNVKAGDVYEITYEQDIDLTGGDYLLSMSCTGYEKGNLTAYHRCYDLVSVTVISDKYNVGFYDMNSKTTVRKL